MVNKGLQTVYYNASKTRFEAVWGHPKTIDVDLKYHTAHSGILEVW